MKRFIYTILMIIAFQQFLKAQQKGYTPKLNLVPALSMPTAA